MQREGVVLREFELEDLAVPQAVHGHDEDEVDGREHKQEDRAEDGRDHLLLEAEDVVLDHGRQCIDRQRPCEPEQPREVGDCSCDLPAGHVGEAERERCELDDGEDVVEVEEQPA